MNEILEKYETPNMTLAATLVSLNHPLSHVKMSGRGFKGIFCFDNVPSSVLMEFDQGTIRVDPSIFHMCLKRLSTMAKGIANNG